MSSNDSLNERATLKPVAASLPCRRLLIDASKDACFDDTYQVSLPCAIKRV
jgi:hypothetical protein